MAVVATASLLLEKKLWREKKSKRKEITRAKATINKQKQTSQKKATVYDSKTKVQIL